MKYLVVGLGNIGEEYAHTRHNIGFDVVEALASKGDTIFTAERYAFRASVKFKGRTLVLIKPTTYMNLSGKAVRYWLEKEKIQMNSLMVVVDDLALPFGSIRMRGKGGAGGHNGLSDIENTLGGANYSRLRFGIGDDFQKGTQVNHVLSRWSAEESKELPRLIDRSCEMVRSFTTIGLDRTMTLFNKKP